MQRNDPLGRGEAFVIALEHLRRHHPRQCPNCGERFETPEQYLRKTTRLGPPMLFDPQLPGPPDAPPIGALSYANCACGSSLSVSGEGMPPEDFRRLVGWARDEARDREVGICVVLDELRMEVHVALIGQEDAASRQLRRR